MLFYSCGIKDYIFFIDLIAADFSADHTVVHHQHAGAVPDDLLQIRRNQQTGNSIRGKFMDKIIDFPPGPDIHTAGRFVKNEYDRIGIKPFGQSDFLLITAAEAGNCNICTLTSDAEAFDIFQRGKQLFLFAHDSPRTVFLQKRSHCSIFKQSLPGKQCRPLTVLGKIGYPAPKKKRLKRQIKEEALLRLEEAARTEDDFAAVQYHWDRRDSNRERKERYHEVLRGDVPLDVGIAKNPHIFPEWLGTPVAQQMRSGNYLDWLANCPYEMHDLLADAVLSSLIYSLKEDHKENFYYSAIQLLQSQEVAKLMGQSTRNIRKKRNVILRKLRAGWYECLRTKPTGSLSLDEKDFLRKYKKSAPDGFGSGKEVCYEAAV